MWESMNGVRRCGLGALPPLVWVIVLMIMSAIAPTAGFAAEVRGLYEAEAQVFSQKRSERATAMVAALAEVLVKVSGQRDAALRQGVARAIRSPAKFLQQYRYRALSKEQRERALQAGAVNDLTGRDPQIVFFRFDKTAVDKVLRNNGLPVWGSTRPATLAWLAVQDENQRYLLASDSSEPTRELLTTEAQRRGLALLLPLMDLEDQRSLSFADVWGGFREPILRASARYPTESVLVGRMYRTLSGEWRAQWTLLEGQQVQSWTAAGMLPTEVIDEGIAGAIEVLASRYAPVVGDQAGLLPVTVMDVRTLRDYARVTRYLKSLQQVGQVQVVQVDADQVTFELEVEGGPEAIAQTIALGTVLQRYQPLVMENGTANGEWVSWAERNMQTYQLIP
ncbi:DUF2066 domain-containing protein [Beggiatoa alba]|nr:DUF2066 domain-containing protein [Beggiatoa alba]